MSNDVKRYLEAVDYKFSEGHSERSTLNGDHCMVINSHFGHASSSISFRTSDNSAIDISVMTETGDVFGYRWIHPDLIEDYKKEYERLGLDFYECMDGVKWAYTDCLDDILVKVEAIRKNEPFDRKVVMSFDLEEDLVELLETTAKKMGITMDELILLVIQEAIEKEEKLSESDNKVVD